MSLILFIPSGLSAHADEVDRFLLETMKNRNIPGLQIAVVQNGEIIKKANFGVANYYKFDD